MGRLADGENAGGLDAKKHWRSLNPFSGRKKQLRRSGPSTEAHAMALTLTEVV
jgi:hypothetical protein